MTNLPELRRDRADAKVVGVCAALARSWNVDPLLVRVGFVVLSLLTNGFAVVAYLALAVLIPERGATTEPVRDLFPFTRSWTSQQLIGAVVVASVLIGLVVSGSGPGAVVVALLVLAILRWGTRKQPPPPSPAPPTPRTEFERLSQVWQQRQDNVAAGLPPDWTPAPARPPFPAAGVDPDPYGLNAPAPVATAARNPARRRHSIRTWSGVAVGLGLAWAGLAALQASGVAVVPLAWCAVTLAVLAGALVLVARPSRAVHGRPHLLLATTIVTALTTSLVMVGAPMVVTEQRTPPPATYFTTEALPDAEVFEIGSRTLDLSEVAVDRDRTVRFTTELGRMRVVLPSEGNVVVRSKVEMGQSRLLDGAPANGVELSSTWRRIEQEGAPTLTLDLTVELGSLEVVAR